MKNNLIEELRKTKKSNTLFVSHYFFALNNGKYLIFYYNHLQYWDRCLISEIDNSVINNLHNECAVFENFDPDGISDNRSFDNRIPHKSFFPETPKIGNHYSLLGDKIVSHHRYFYFLPGDFGAGCFKIHVKNLTIDDIILLFAHGSVMTNTPKYIKSIYDLNCFKKQRFDKGEKQLPIYSNTIIGAIAGDVIGSVYEWNNIKTTDFDLFNTQCKYTDDTVLTIAVADSILNNKDFSNTIWEYGRKYRGRGYGGNFRNWLDSDNPKPYGSFGNGSAMRVSAVGYAFNDLQTVLDVAKQTADVTHNHPEGIKGAQATASAIYLARNGKLKKEIKDYLIKTFDYDLDFTLDSIRPTYSFDVTCQGSVPQAIVAFLESTDFENSIRLAISIGGDSDTIACITGGIAAAYYKEIPKRILEFVSSKLPNEFIEILNRFDKEKITNA
jgi:ADP-ribosylglycohydrolase